MILIHRTVYVNTCATAKRSVFVYDTETAATPPVSSIRMQASHKPRRRTIAIAVLLCLLAAETVFLAVKWPFTRERIATSLSGFTSSKVQIGRFESTFFPHPGCVLHDVSVERASQKLAVARDLTIVGSWAALLTLQHYVSRIDIRDAQVTLPSPIPPPEESGDGKTTETKVGELTANGAVLRFGEKEIAFPKLNLQNVSKDAAINYDFDFTLPQPNGRVTMSGSFGPWQKGDTPLKGSFRMHEAKLSLADEVDGTISADGKFDGILQKIRVTGQTDTPDFQVKRHRVHLTTDYAATVNGATGAVYLDSVEARFGNTVLQAKGAIERKTVTVDFTSDNARIEDLMRLTTKADRPALNGPVTLRVHVVVPPGEGKFLRKVRLDGDFSIQNASFTKPRTQAKVSELSARSRGRDVGEDEPAPERVVSDLKGHVVLRDGTATLSQVIFSVPGATARGGGTYDLIDKRVNLRGQVAMAATVSEASGGIKSFFLKPFNALFKRKNAGAVLPVSITGYYPRPKFQVSLRP